MNAALTPGLISRGDNTHKRFFLISAQYVKYDGFPQSLWKFLIHLKLFYHKNVCLNLVMD